MKDPIQSHSALLVRALMGYVIIIALILVFIPKRGIDLAVRLANGMVPLFFFVLGSILSESVVFICLKIKNVREERKNE